MTSDMRGVTPSLLDVKVNPSTPPLGTYRTSAATALGQQKFNHVPEVEAFVDSDGALWSADRDAERVRVDARVLKWVLHAGVKALLPNHLTAVCCSAVLPAERRGVLGVEVWKSAKHGTAHYGNLMTCGYVWSCPICAPKVAARRAVEVEQAVSAHHQAGGRVLFLTLTLPHYAHDDLVQLLPDYTGALSSFWSRRGVKDALRAVGFAGSIRALEVTHGENGWHPHTHYLLFVKDLGVGEQATLEACLRSTWERVVSSRLDRYVTAHGLSLVKVGGGSEDGGTDEDAQQLAGYVTKWGASEELTRGHIKKGRRGGRTPFALLYDYATSDDKRAGALFVEFVRAFHGRRQLSWSKGLRSKLLGSEVEASDQELAERVEEEAVLLGTLTLDQWRRVLAGPRRDTRGLLLEVAASGGWQAVETFLSTLPPFRAEGSAGRSAPRPRIG